MGYQEVTIPAQQFTMIGVMFEAPAGGAISVQDLFPNPLGQGLTGYSGQANADQLMYWDPNESSGYVTLFLNSNTGTSSAAIARHNKWCCAGTPADSSWGSKNNASPKTLVSGMGLWLKRYNYTNPITLTMSGAAVKAEDGRTLTINEGFNMISGGFSSTFVPNPDTAGTGSAINWLSKGCVGGAGQAAADQLMFWDTGESSGYVTLFLNSNTATSSAALARHNHWCCAGSPADSSWGSKNNASPKVIPAGRGVWYKRLAGSGSFTLTLDKPYSLD